MKNRSRTLGDSSASWNQGKAPDDWKEANVSPIFKKGDKSQPYGKSNRKAMNRNCSNQKANPALKTKAGNK